MVKVHTVDYNLVLQYQPQGYLASCFHGLLKLYFSPKHLTNFLSNHILPWLGKIFKFMVPKLLENAFANQKIESSHFDTCLLGKTLTQVLVITTQAEGNYFERTVKVTKIKLVQVLATSLDKSHHLYILHIFDYCFAIPYLDSNMLKSRNSLT